jgi:hypothetical protein
LSGKRKVSRVGVIVVGIVLTFWPVIVHVENWFMGRPWSPRTT